MNKTDILDFAIKILSQELKDDLAGGSLKNDITSNSLIENKATVHAVISNREEIVMCGEFFIKKFISKKFPQLKYISKFRDGQKIKKNSKLISIKGNLKIILAIERTVLNFMQHLSGISTFTNELKEQLEDSNTELLDTRKTLMGLRKIQKYATAIGGAKNHRMGLFDKILVKDNHIKSLGGIFNTLKKLREINCRDYMIECDSYYQVKKCIENNSSYILLDNMKPREIIKCIKLKRKLSKKVLFEITGGINNKNFKKYSKLGADFISIGKITNCPKSVDIGLDII